MARSAPRVPARHDSDVPPPAEPRHASPWHLGTLLIAALIVKLAVAWQLSPHPLLQPQGGLDAESYVALGRRVAAGDWTLGPDPFFLSPLYIYFLGVVLGLSGGSLAAVHAVQAVLGTAAVALVYWAGRRVMPHHAALTGAALAAATGLFTFHEALTIQAALDPFLAALALWSAGEALASPRRPWLLAAGAAVGLFALNRPNVLLIAAAIAALNLLRPPLRRGLVQAGWFLAGLVLVIAPVTIRNLAVSGDVVLISSHGGLNFYIGNNATADGTYRAVPNVRPSIVGQAEDARRVAEAALGRPVRPSEVSSFFYGRAFDWIASDPRRALALFARKVAYTFNSTDVALNYSYAYHSRDEPNWLRFVVIGPWCLLPLGLMGTGIAAWNLRGRRGIREGTARDQDRSTPGAACAWLVFIIVYALSVAAFFVSGRYRLPLLVPLCLTSGLALAWLGNAMRARHVGAAVTGVVALAVLAALTNWPLGLDDGRSSEREEMILFLVDNHRDGKVRDLLERTEPTHPDRGRLLLRVGTALLERGDPSAAIPYLERAALLASDRPVVERALGEALYAAGEAALQSKRPEVALPYLDKAVARDPQSASAREKRGLALAMLDRVPEGRAELERARALDADSASVCLNLAVLYAQEGRLDLARTLAREALRLQPDYPQATGLLSTLEGLR